MELVVGRGLASRAVVAKATATADVLKSRSRGLLMGVEAFVSENAHLCKAALIGHGPC